MVPIIVRRYSFHTAVKSPSICECIWTTWTSGEEKQKVICTGMKETQEVNFIIIIFNLFLFHTLTYAHTLLLFLQLFMFHVSLSNPVYTFYLFLYPYCFPFFCYSCYSYLKPMWYFHLGISCRSLFPMIIPFSDPIARGQYFYAKYFSSGVSLIQILIFLLGNLLSIHCHTYCIVD